ncbi:uncharacterized protein LOC135079419 [Ostrinia nubilalis]|uniref:uncharacterized protein LOC135079418 n=1 Tax=Ostrinia nubilalis TaxID=29057 RepID=UPI0030824AEE
MASPQIESVQITPIPNEMLRLIPFFNGDKKHLNLFLKKCEYVISRYRGGVEQDLYVYHAITSRLTENAAALLSEQENLTNWSELKEILTQHFGDPRSEACINIELESLKIRSNESYTDFCNRVQSTRSMLISKVNTIADESIRHAKITIYNNTALNVFLYNLPENLVRIVRLKAPSTLEAALSIVLEEVNFMDQYNMRSKMHSQPKPNNSFTPTQQKFSGNQPHFVSSNAFKPIIPPQFKFGLPPNQGYKPFQQYGNKPLQQFGYFKPPHQPGFRPPQQFGYRPPQQFGYRPPQQFGYRHPPQQFGYKPPQFGYKPQFGAQQAQQVQPPRMQLTDVSMRTATKPNNVNETNLNDLNYDEAEQSYYDQYYCEYPIDEYNNMYSEQYYPDFEETPEETQETEFQQDFHETASIKEPNR